MCADNNADDAVFMGKGTYDTRLIDVFAAVQQLRRPSRVDFDRPNHRRLTALLRGNAKVFGNVKAEGGGKKHRDAVLLAGDEEGGRVSRKLIHVLQRQTSTAIRRAVGRVHELRGLVAHDAH